MLTLKRIALIATAMALTANTGFTCTPDGTEGIVPENNMNIPFNAKSVYTIDQTEFNAVIDKVTAIYDPVVTQMGGELSVERNWDDGTVNAYASRRGGTWNIHMFGGLARHEAITSDGFALVVCHELGHHIGGAPKKGGWFGTWATNEGQADYFSTLKCLRKVFRGDPKALQRIKERARLNVAVVDIQGFKALVKEGSVVAGDAGGADIQKVSLLTPERVDFCGGAPARAVKGLAFGVQGGGAELESEVHPLDIGAGAGAKKAEAKKSCEQRNKLKHVFYPFS